MVEYHYGTAYSERIALVERDLKDLTLNGCYEYGKNSAGRERFEGVDIKRML